MNISPPGTPRYEVSVTPATPRKEISSSIGVLDHLPKNRFVVDIAAKIGQGSFGDVFPGADGKRSHKPIIAKVIHPGHIDSALDEWANGLAMFGHPNIPKVYGLYKLDGSLVLIQERMMGKDLSEYILSKNGKVDEDVARNIMWQLLEVIVDMHAKGITHRDLKPANIFLDEQEYPKVCVIDLGASSSIERKKSMVGTPAYMAPEIIHEDYDSQVDSWSIGTILYLMLTGESPFPGNIISYLNREGHFALTEKQIQFVTKQSSPLGADLVKQLLETDPKKRFTPQQALDHLWFLQEPSRHWTLGKISSGNRDPRRESSTAGSDMSEWVPVNHLKNNPV